MRSRAPPAATMSAADPTDQAYHLVLYRPDHPRFRIMDAHLEVMAALRWGFEACGLPCSMAVNQIDPQRRNIAFGWIMAAQAGLLDALPDGSILYNFEQFSERRIAGTPLAALARRFRVWDYSAANLPRWAEADLPSPAFHAPVVWAPVLERIAPAPVQDIDLLYVGSGGAGRSARIDEIAEHITRPGVVVARNIWGETRDSWIARARLMLNLTNDNPALRIFEVVRVSYYLANRKAVVCEAVPGHFVESDLLEALPFAPRAQLGDLAASLLADPALRQRWAERGYEAFRQRDARALVQRWLS